MTGSPRLRPSRGSRHPLATALAAAVLLPSACDPDGFGSRRLESEAELRRPVMETIDGFHGDGIVYAAVAPGWYLFHGNEN